MAMGAIARTPSRDAVVGFSYPYFITRVGFFTKKPSPLPKLLAVIGPYSEYVWVALGVSVAVFSLVFLMFSKIDKEGFARNLTFDNAIIQVSQILIMQGIKQRRYHIAYVKRYIF